MTLVYAISGIAPDTWCFPSQPGCVKPSIADVLQTGHFNKGGRSVFWHAGQRYDPILLHPMQRLGNRVSRII